MKILIKILPFLCFFYTINAQNTNGLSLAEIDNLANYWQGLGKFDKALVYANKSLEISQKTKVDTSIEKSLYRLGAIYSDDNKPEKAEGFYIQALTRIKKRVGEKNDKYCHLLDAIGVLYTRSGRYEEAEVRLQESMIIGKEIFGAESIWVGSTSLRLGEIAYYLGRYEEAIDLFLKSKKIYGKDLKNHPHDYSICLNNLGTMYSTLGRYEEAEPVYQEALKVILEVIGKKHEYLASLNNIAFLYYDMGDYERAEALFLEAIELGGQDDMLGKKHTTYADYLSNLAALYLKLNRFEEAEQLFQTTLNIYGENLGKMHPSYASALNNLAVLYQKTNRSSESENFYRKSLAINLKVLGNNHVDYAAQLNNLANLLRADKKYEGAEKLMLEATQIYKKALGQGHPQYAYSLTYLGALYQETQRFALAKQSFEQAKNIYVQSFGKEHPEYASSLYCLANFYLEIKQLDSAKTFCWAAIEANSPDNISSKDGSNLETYSYYSEAKMLEFLTTFIAIYKAQYEVSKDKKILQNIYTLTETALRFGDRIKNGFQASGNKLQLLQTTHSLAAIGIQTAFNLNDKTYFKNAFSLAEHNKSVLLSDATKSQRARSLGDLPDSLALKELNLNEQLGQFKKQAIEAKGGDKDIVLQQINDLNFQLDALKKQLEKNYPNYYKLKYANSTANAESIQKLLNEKTLFVEYFISDSSIYLFALTKDQVRLHELKITTNQLKQKTADLRKALTNYDFIVKEEAAAQQLYTNNAHWFYQNLLDVAIKNAKDIDALIIVADGELGHLPFEAFLTENVQGEAAYKDLPYLLKKHKVSYNYSATLFKENKEKNALSTNKNFNGKMLAMASSYKGLEDEQQHHATRAPHLRTLRDGLQDLPAAKAEVAALSQIFAGEFLQGDSCNEQYFKDKAGEYGIIHLAMHGLLNQRAPILSSLAFTENGDSLQDNFLEAWEIAHLKLNAQLVVLSACETGYGKFEQGEGILSLARSFMYAGVPSLIVSLWQVNDYSTSAIMQKFYQNLSDGMDKAAALQKAKLDYIQIAEGIAAHPAFWAAFVQLGDSSPVAVETQTKLSIAWVLGGLVLLVGGGFGVAEMRKRR